MATILYGLEVPDAGGDTMFLISGCLEALSDGMKNMLSGLRVVNTNANSYGKGSQRFTDGVAKAMEVSQAAIKEVTHPVVRTHPETGRKGLYLSDLHFVRFADMIFRANRGLCLIISSPMRPA